MKYLIALDLDSTLLTEEKTITQKTKDYLKKIIDDGHKVVIATGRPFSGMYAYYKELNLDTPIVNSNGSLVHNPNDANFNTIHFGIDKDIVKDICFKSKDYIKEGFFGFENKIYYTNCIDHLGPFIHTDEDSIIKQGDLHEICDVDTGGLILLIKSQNKNEFESYIKENYKDLATRVFYENEEHLLYEVYQSTISKASGLEVVLDFYNMTTKNLIAIGDGSNDIEMIEYAYVGVAMINAQEEVRNKAKYITKLDNDNDGVVQFLDHFLEYNTLD